MDAQSGGKSVVKTTIGYNDPSSTTATGQVRTWKSGATTYTYAYDARGNITSVSDGQSTTTYAYDSFDQLVRENSQAVGKTWTYAYDDGGNILSKTEYAYTTGSLGAAVRTMHPTHFDEFIYSALCSHGSLPPVVIRTPCKCVAAFF